MNRAGGGVFRGKVSFVEVSFVGVLFLNELVSFRSSLQINKSGTTKSVIIWTNMPPNVGIAIGTMISDPLPIILNKGSKAKMVVAVVNMVGLIRLVAASTPTFLRC